MPVTPLRSGIVGFGFIGEVHARAVRAAGGVVAGVAASSPDRAAVGAARVGAEHAFDSAIELIESDDIDVVHVCTPNAHHLDIAEHALKNGKTVICEKPLALSRTDAEHLASIAETNSVVTAVPFVYRFYPTVRDARHRIANGETGRLRVLHGSYLQDWMSNPADGNWRVDPAAGGASRAFADIGVHWCDLMEFTTGHRIVRISARTVIAFAQRGADPAGMVDVTTEDAATVMFETDRGAIGSVVVSQVSPGRKNRLWFSFDGADASVGFNQESPDSLWLGGRTTNQTVMRSSETLPASAQRYSLLPAGHPQGYQDCFDAFVGDVYATVRGETVDGLPTFADGLRAAVLTDAVLRSAATDSWIEVAT